MKNLIKTQHYHYQQKFSRLIENYQRKLCIYAKNFLSIISYNDLSQVFIITVCSRAIIFLLAHLFNNTFNVARSPEWLLCSWDCPWYLTIIDHGYDLLPSNLISGEANWAFFPLFPVFAKALARLTGINILTSATLIPNVFFILSSCLLFLYARRITDVRTSKFIVTVFAFSPYSLYFSVPYTESLYLFLMLSTLYSAHSNRWILAGFFAVFLSATRNLGAFVVFPLLAIGISQHGWKEMIRFSNKSLKILFCLSVAPLGLFLYMFFLHQHVGDAFAFKNVQVAWGRSLSNPISIISNALMYGSFYDRYCAIVACLSIIAAIFLMNKRLWSEGLCLFIGVIIPASTGIQSMPRYAFTLFPIFIALGLLTKKLDRYRLVMIGSLCPILGFMIISWITNKWYMI